jgi:hypothetical protein
LLELAQAGGRLSAPSQPPLPGAHRRDGDPVPQSPARAARPGAARRGGALSGATRSRAGLRRSGAPRPGRSQRSRLAALAPARCVLNSRRRSETGATGLEAATSGVTRPEVLSQHQGRRSSHLGIARVPRARCRDLRF